LEEIFNTENNNISPTLPNEDRKLKLPTGKVIIFNDDQYEGLSKIRQWLYSKDVDSKKFFTLSGFPGTGKSTIIKKIINEYRKQIVVSAPTHKAKKIIANTTDLDAETLHGLLGLRPDINLDEFNPNDPKFNQIAKPRLCDYHFVIIDEASMVNQELFDLIIKESKISPKTKILFMGDICQIPPVGEKVSAVFNSPLTEIYHLTKVMRQDDMNPLLGYLETIRENLTLPNGGIKRITKLNDGGEGIVFTSNKKIFRELLKDKFVSENYKNDPDFCKIIVWRNKTVLESNEIIREFIFGKNPNILELGDVLMAYKSIRHQFQYYNVIDNSMDYVVHKLSNKYKNTYGLFGYDVTIKEYLIKGGVKYRKVFIIDHTDHDNLHNYAETHDTLKEIAIFDKNRWNGYYTFRRENMVMVDINKFRNGITRENKEKIAKDIDYGYTITAHKCQGSTYLHVFMLENDMSINPKIKEQNQIKYVALSRPSKTAYVLTNLK
jgi:ATP-dependent exoDNAse (exonuclease V) alpha subunit